ncbi:NPCBM/NEW2 domain-containing protein, partial [Deinococcus humi]|uniref:NPCBM/NEW2 domain-containing protein n=1 Tax=Deinococcus humi TaxID=662880 RepID=UPI00161580BF
VNVNLTGARELRMVVTNGGDNIDYDHADWANPTITCVSSTPPAQPAGTLDPSFGQGGRVKVSGVDVVAEPGGAVAVVGKNFKVTRLSASGAVVAQSTDQFDGQANGLARQSDGKLIVAGQVDGQLAAIRFLSNLTLDSSFGAGGVVKLPLGGTNTSELGSSALDVAVQPDGKIVLGGRVRQQFNQDFVLVRLQSNGTRDASFGQNGVAITALEDLPAYSYASGISDEFISGLALQPDGKIVVAGQASGGFGDEAVLARYSSSGQLDASFSGDGIAKGIIDGYGGFRTVAVLPDGELLAGGSTQRALARAFLQKFSADGMPGSRVVFNFNDENYLESETIIYALAVQDDGGVIVGGGNQAFSSVNTDGTYLARFSAALVQDTTFGGAADGNVKINGDTFIALANSGNTIVATTPSADPVGGTVRVFR